MQTWSKRSTECSFQLERWHLAGWQSEGSPLFYNFPPSRWYSQGFKVSRMILFYITWDYISTPSNQSVVKSHGHSSELNQVWGHAHSKLLIFINLPTQSHPILWSNIRGVEASIYLHALKTIVPLCLFSFSHGGSILDFHIKSTMASIQPKGWVSLYKHLKSTVFHHYHTRLHIVGGTSWRSKIQEWQMAWGSGYAWNQSV